MKTITQFWMLVSVLALLSAAQLPHSQSSDASTYNWSVGSDANLTRPGQKVVQLTSCPKGVGAKEPEYWVYINDGKASEAVKVSGGTCNGDGKPGTLEFQTSKSHQAGYQLGSASDGLQEASIATRITTSNPTDGPLGGVVRAAAGEFNVYARVTIRSSFQTVDLTGSVVNCYVDDTCIFIGAANANTFGSITVLNPIGRPMMINGTKPFMEVNANKTRIINLASRDGIERGTFGTYVQVDDDQAFLLDGLDTSTGRVLRCDSEFCGAYVTAPGPFNRRSAVGWLKHLNINAQCHGNGIDWQSGNTLHVQDSVIEGLQQFAIRSGVARGGYGGTEIDNAYIEQSTSCKNPLGNVGQAGVIQQGNNVVMAGVPGGIFPTFAERGRKEYHYYVVAKHGDYVSVPLYAGRTFSTGSDSIPVVWPEISEADGYDLLRTNYTSGVEVAPYGRGEFKVASVPRNACSGGVCRHTDTNAALGPYSVAGPSFIPKLNFWPGGLVLSGNGRNLIYAGATAYLESADSTTGIIATLGSRRPAVFAKTCGGAAQYTPVWMVCLSDSYAPESAVPPAALMVTKSFTDGKNLNLKGRLNLGTFGIGPGHIITLYDSNLDKTIATSNYRPANDANDAYIGVDQGDGNPAKYGISFGAPSSLSNYIGNIGDGTSWKERLTAGEKLFRVPIKTDSQIISTVRTGKAPLSVESRTPVFNLLVANHPTVQDCGNSSDCSSSPIVGAKIIFGKSALRNGAATVKGVSPGFESVDSYECTANDRTSPTQPANATPLTATSIALSGSGSHLVSYICVGK